MNPQHPSPSTPSSFAVSIDPAPAKPFYIAIIQAAFPDPTKQDPLLHQPTFIIHSLTKVTEHLASPAGNQKLLDSINLAKTLAQKSLPIIVATEYPFLAAAASPNIPRAAAIQNAATTIALAIEVGHIRAAALASHSLFSAQTATAWRTKILSPEPNPIPLSKLPKPTDRKKIAVLTIQNAIQNNRLATLQKIHSLNNDAAESICIGIAALSKIPFSPNPPKVF